MFSLTHFNHMPISKNINCEQFSQENLSIKSPVTEIMV